MSWTSRRVFKHAIKWLAAEHKYFRELREDLEELQEDIREAKGAATEKEKKVGEKEILRDIRHAFRDFRYIAKSERRFEQKDKQIQEILHKLKGIAGAESAASKTPSRRAEELLRESEAAANYLVKVASYYEGAIRDRLLYIQHEAKEHELDKVLIALNELEEIIETSQRWIAALQVDLREARKLEEEHFRRHGGLSEAEWEEFLTKNPESNIEVIAEKFFYDRSLPMKSKKILLKLFFRELEKVLKAGNHLRVEYVLDKYKLPLPRAWKMLGDYLLEQARKEPVKAQYYYLEAAKAYAGMGKEGAELRREAASRVKESMFRRR